MQDDVRSARTPVLAGALGSVLLVGFWALCLLGPAALAGSAGPLLGAEGDESALLAFTCLAATGAVFKRAAGNHAAWRGM